ncbi:hypothetical protein BD324DRAFT_473117 [Kockovaella imperatae]|uniref:SUR7/PalI family-domain-containing protein n=1 Tax=Kockovaella imperatae TaxID=4999 RepID=A0A1Y1UH46_9TREE|nr:hypothetical protein BD324DRAFT_473117 [Kockovaella imperatae]ORX36847.1 hypothetical protein BD324DRAFT_473117 [Kockovaella imperatae]
MPVPDRTVGLPIHLLYPIISSVLLAVASFSSADSVWYVSANTPTETIRFAAQNYCGYNVSNLQITDKLGCIYRGWQYQIPDGYFGFDLPTDISKNFSKVVVTSVVAFALVVVAGVHHAYFIRYSFRKMPEPNKDKLWSLAQLHFVSIVVVFLFTWIAFIAQATIIGNSVGGDPQRSAVAIYWGQSTWLVLAAAILHTGWGYEAVRWRAAMLK